MKEPVKVTDHPTKIGGQKYCSSSRDMFLVCHVMKQNDLIKRSDDYNDRNPSKPVIILPSLVVIGTVVLVI